MKKGSVTLKQLAKLGFVEYEPGRFARGKRPMKVKRSKATPMPLVDTFTMLAGIELNIELVMEYRFSHRRRWRFDYAVIAHKIAIEVEGGVFTNGRHTRSAGFMNDMEKYNAAAAAGWRLIRTTPAEIKNNPGKVLGMVKQIIETTNK